MSHQQVVREQDVGRYLPSETSDHCRFRWCRSVEWKPSPIVALATIADDARVAAAREDGSLEIWLVSPGSVGWHCQLTMHGDASRRVSSLVWCSSGSKKDASSGWLFSSSVDGSISMWDLYNLKQKTALESRGVSIWQMAVRPRIKEVVCHEHGSLSNGNGVVIDRYDDDNASESCSSDDDGDSVEIDEGSLDNSSLLAVACDDGCVQLYTISDTDELIYNKSLPRVSGRALSVTWSPDGHMIYAGSSEGLIRCWDAKLARELYRITVGLGGLGSGPELCVWSLLALRSGALVSADSTGTVQFWDSQHGTLLQAYSLHKGDVNALAADPAHNRVFSGGSDGQVILYSLSSSTGGSSHNAGSPTGTIKKWVYIGHHRPHTHDVRALTVATPVIQEDSLPEVNVKKRRREKPNGSNYLKWAHMGVPMLLSGSDDTKIFAYSAKEFTKFSPHDICPAPQRLPVQLVPKSVFNQIPLLLVQSASSVEILTLREKDIFMGEGASGRVSAHPVVRVNKGSQKIICSTISPSGSLFSFSNHVKISLFQLKKCEVTKDKWSINRMDLPAKLPSAHCMIFTSDSSQLIIAGHDRRVYVIDAQSSKLVHIFTPRCKEEDEDVPPSMPPITKMFVSLDGQWLAVINCFGDIYIFNLEVQRQHWFISRLDGASVAAGGFHPLHNNVLVITTSTNQLYEFDVEAKQLGEWSRRNSLCLPIEFLEFPGEVIGLSFSPSTSSSSIVIYSSRAMCSINFWMPVYQGTGGSISKKLINSPINGRLKRKLQEHDLDVEQLYGRKNFKFEHFNDPVLFAGHLSKSSILLVYKPWLDVVKNLDVQPVHKHIYGT